MQTMNNGHSNATGTPKVEGPALQAATPQEVQRWMTSGEAVLIDVREPDEFAREHIPGAMLVPLSRFDLRQVSSAAKRGQKVVMQCRSGRRSSDAARMAASLASSGLTIVNLTGGIEGWKKAQLPVEVDAKAPGISVMRQVQLVIGVSVLIGSALAWLVSPAFIAVTAFFGAGMVFAGATGTCALASLIGAMPWNRVAKQGGQCGTSCCG